MKEVDSPGRGEIWLAQLDPTRGREQAGTRPVLIVSSQRFNSSSIGLVFVCPLTTRDRQLPNHIGISPPEGDLRQESFVMSEQLRSISTERLLKRWGTASEVTTRHVLHAIRFFLSE